MNGERHQDGSNPIERDWLDDLLRDDGREHREQYVADEGFTARVMDTLPGAAPYAALPSWRKPVLAAMWALAALGVVAALPDAAADGAQLLLRAFDPQRLSLTDVGGMVLALGAATWAGMGYALRKV